MVLRFLLILSLLLAAIGLGYIGWLAVRPPSSALQAEHEAPPPPAQVSVLVAAQPLQVGSLLKDSDLAVREFPGDALPEGALAQSDDNRAELHGAMLRRFVDAGGVISKQDVLRLRDSGFLAAVLRSGTRAISVGVDAVTGASGLIWPGDHVDLILTQEMDAATTAPGRRVVGETILTDARVIAVDQKIARGGPDGTTTAPARTVTLEVTPEQAERVAVATRLGNISLVVRSSDQQPEPPAPRSPPIFSADVSAALLAPAPAIASRMRVIQGDDQKDVVLP